MFMGHPSVEVRWSNVVSSCAQLQFLQENYERNAFGRSAGHHGQRFLPEFESPTRIFPSPGKRTISALPSV